MNVAIVYHYLAHYRLPVFRELCQNKEPEFSLFSGNTSSNDIKTIDQNLAKIEVSNGGLRWDFLKNIWLGKDRFLWQQGLIKLCYSKNYDAFIFLGNPYFISTWIAAIILKIRSIPFYFWTHGAVRNEKGLKGFVRNAFNKLPTGLFLYGNYAKSILINNGFESKKLHVIYNSLDCENQKIHRESLNSKGINDFKTTLFKNPANPQLIFIGRLTRQKKLFQIIEAAEILHKQGILVNLLFVGDGTEKHNLIQLTKNKGLHNFTCFFGASYDEATNSKLITSSDICVAPGEVGLTSMHSLVYGTAVITHNNFENQMPEFEAIEKEISGDFFEEDDVFDLALKIKEWIEKNPDRSEVRKRCYSIIDQKYNPKKQKEIICNVLKNETIT